MLTRTVPLLAALLAAPCLPAQVLPGVFGFLVQSSGGTAGEFCHVFDCTPRALAVADGDTLTFRVNTELGEPFAIGIAPTATGCTRIAGLANALILDAPILTLALGVVTRPSPVLACWTGTETVRLPLPRGLSGVAFATQAIAGVPTPTSRRGVGFSVAVFAKIR